MVPHRIESGRRKGDMDRQKQIWKICFGDDDAYIDFYFANRYKRMKPADASGRKNSSHADHHSG